LEQVLTGKGCRLVVLLLVVVVEIDKGPISLFSVLVFEFIEVEAAVAATAA